MLVGCVRIVMHSMPSAAEPQPNGRPTESWGIKTESGLAVHNRRRRMNLLFMILSRHDSVFRGGARIPRSLRTTLAIAVQPGGAGNPNCQEWGNGQTGSRDVSSPAAGNLDDCSTVRRLRSQRGNRRLSSFFGGRVSALRWLPAEAIGITTTTKLKLGCTL